MTAILNARITVTLKEAVLDPQGKAIEHGLHSLGFSDVASVRQGKVFDIALRSNDRDRAEAELAAMCEKLLANQVIEDYHVTIEGKR